MKKTLISFVALTGMLFLSFSDNSPKLSKIWETDDVFMTPESIVYDSLRNCLYISNFNDKGGFRKSGDTLFDECISKVDLKGNIIKFKWVEELIGPTGIIIFRDTLYVVERGYLTKVNIETQKIINRLEIKGTGFLNDIAIDRNGEIYISDSRNKQIIRVKDNQYETWLNDTILKMPNGLFIDNDNLIIGNKDEANLFSVSIPDKNITTLLANSTNGIDGLKKIGDNYIVSWQYNIFQVNKKGVSNIILDTSQGKDWNADFEFVKDKNIIVVPSLLTNKVFAYKFEMN